MLEDKEDLNSSDNLAFTVLPRHFPTASRRYFLEVVRGENEAAGEAIHMKQSRKLRR